jgi:putative flippase GtrA
MEALELEAAPAPRAPAQLARFLAVGPCGIALGALQYELIWRFAPDVSFRSGASSALSSALGIAWIHAVHCRFTFRAGPGAWRRTIASAYGAYAASGALGALLMLALADVQGFPRLSSWLCSTALASLLNFGLLRRLVCAVRLPAP